MIELKMGNCLEIMKNIPDNSIDCIVTSPPYNKSFFNKNKKSNQIWGGFTINYNTYSDNMPLDEYENFMINFINLSLKKIKKNGSIFFNHKPIRYNNNVYLPIKFILQSNAKIYQEIIWNRHNSPNIRNDILVPCTERIYWLCKDKPIVYRNNIEKQYISEVWDIIPKKCNEHPAPFPLELPLNCILLTTQSEDIVCDPFMGIGTTGMACKNLNRNFIGIELDEKYFKIAKEKIENYEV